MAQPELGFIHRFVPAAEPVALGGALWPDAALLSPRGQGPRKRMPRFFRHLAEEVFDIDDLKFRTHELARRLWQVRGRAIWVSRQKHCGGGVFERANIASSFDAAASSPASGAVLFRPMVPFPMDFTPDLRRMHVLLAPGKRDPIIAPEQVDMLVRMLETAGADISLSWHDGGHELGQNDLIAAKNWLSRQF